MEICPKEANLHNPAQNVNILGPIILLLPSLIVNDPLTFRLPASQNHALNLGQQHLAQGKPAPQTINW